VRSRELQVPHRADVQLHLHHRGMPTDLRHLEQVLVAVRRREMRDHLRNLGGLQRRVCGRWLHDQLRDLVDVHHRLPGRRMHHDLRGQRDLHCDVRRRELHVHRRGVQVTRALAALAVATVLALAGSDAHAQGAPDTVRAKEAYARGVAAHERGDLGRAAREFAAADSLAPNAVVLQAALDAAVDADDPVIGGELLERSKRVAAPVNPKLARSIEAARKKLGGRAGRVRVTCPAGTTCSATLDGAPFDTKSATWTVTGPHSVVVQLDGETQSMAVDVKADDLVELAPARKAAAPPLHPPPPPAAPPPRTPAEPNAPPAPRKPDAPDAPTPRDTTSPSSGLPPFVFFVGLGATVVAGAGAGYFMVTTKSKHDDFVAAGCEAGPAAGCDSLKSSGSSAQTTANIAIGVTAVLAVATVVIGAAFTNWSGDAKKAAILLRGPGAGGSPGATYSLRF